MKRGYIFLLAILLIMPFAFAGQVSDFFSYFTNDAFSLITGASAFSDISETNFNQNDGNSGFTGTSGRTNTPATGNKANGAACTGHSQCASKVCTKITNTKSICGKKRGDPCTVLKKAECFSNSCVSSKCGKSPVGKSCIKTADCVNGLSCKNNKCTAKPAPSAPTTSTVPTTSAAPVTETNVPQSESNAPEEVSLKEEAVNTINQLKNKADELLNKHTTPTGNLVNANVVNLRQYSILSRITGNFMFQALITGAPTVTNKVNGATCTGHSQCASKVCTKITNTKSICGKKRGDPCTVLKKAECFSNSCVSGKCGLSPLGKSCIKTADCVSGTCQNNRCVAAVVMTTPGIAMEAAQIHLANGVICAKDADCASGYCNNAVPRKCAPKLIGMTQTGSIQNNQEVPLQGTMQSRELAQNNLANDAICTASSQCTSKYCNNAVPRKCAPKPIGALCQKSNECKSESCICSAQTPGTCQVLEEPESPAPVVEKVVNVPQLDVNIPGMQGFPVAVPKSCIKNSDCSAGVCVCLPGKGKCTAALKAIDADCSVSSQCASGYCNNAVPRKCAVKPVTGEIKLSAEVNAPVVPVVEQPIIPVENQEQGAASFKGFDWVCYDGTSFSKKMDICKTQAEWMEIANKACNNKCNTANTKCGINSKSFKDKCGAVEETPVVEEPFDVGSAQSKIDDLYVQMNALRQKVIQEASNHNGIDLGSIGCRSPA